MIYFFIGLGILLLGLVTLIIIKIKGLKEIEKKLNITEEKISEIKSYAKENNVPIMMDDGIDFLTSLIRQRKVKNILEIGTAIGYSAIMMALVDENIKITSIEKDNKRYFEAIKNVKKFNLEDRITLLYNDALEVKLKDKYDLIFIDAAKSKNQDIFEHFARNLSDKGAVVTDNLSFHGFVSKETNEIKNRNIRGLVRKIKNYISFLNQNDDYKTVFYEIGDGISVTTKK